MSATEKESQPTPPQQFVGEALTILDLAAVLVKHFNLHEGKFDLTIEFQIGVGAVGPKENQAPGVMMGVSKIGLSQAKSDGPMTVDAAIVNPAKASTPSAAKSVPARKRAASK